MTYVRLPAVRQPDALSVDVRRDAAAAWVELTRHLFDRLARILVRKRSHKRGSPVRYWIDEALGRVRRCRKGKGG
jgi:hypothetical protein